MADANSLMQALQNRGAGGPPQSGGAPSDQEIDSQETEPSMDDEDTEMDPRALSADGETLFIDKDKFPKNTKVGDRCMISATVTKLGAKNGVEIDGIEPEGQEGESEDEGEDDGSEIEPSAYGRK